MLKRNSIIALLSILCLQLLPAVAQREDSFRRLESPEPIQLEGGSRVEFHSFHSRALGKKMAYSIFLPAGYDSSGRVYPVIYFLHGMFNDHTSWCVNRYGDIPAAVETAIEEMRLPHFVMIHPAGENGYYTDSADGCVLYEQAVQQDFLYEAEAKFRISRDREGRAIAGTSMGGYGALKLAFKYPHMYGVVAASSPIVLTGKNPFQELKWGGSDRRAQFFSGLIARVYGDPVDLKHWGNNRLDSLAGNDLMGLKVLMLYGTADRYNKIIPMESGVRKLNALLEAKGVVSNLRVYEGELHGWSLVIEHLQEILGFLTAGFPKESKSQR